VHQGHLCSASHFKALSTTSTPPSGLLWLPWRRFLDPSSLLPTLKRSQPLQHLQMANPAAQSTYLSPRDNHPSNHINISRCPSYGCHLGALTIDFRLAPILINFSVIFPFTAATVVALKLPLQARGESIPFAHWRRDTEPCSDNAKLLAEEVEGRAIVGTIEQMTAHSHLRWNRWTQEVR